jgi:hypothetical protein
MITVFFFWRRGVRWKSQLTCAELGWTDRSSGVCTTSPKCLCSTVSISGEGGVVSDVKPTLFRFPSVVMTGLDGRSSGGTTSIDKPEFIPSLSPVGI